jgi:hypothetical protein
LALVFNYAQLQPIEALWDTKKFLGLTTAQSAVLSGATTTVNPKNRGGAERCLYFLGFCFHLTG